MQDAVIKGIGTGYSTLSDIVDRSNLTPSQVMACLESMERKGTVERSGAVRTRTRHSLDLTGVRRTQAKKDAFAVNRDLTQKASPDARAQEARPDTGGRYSNTDNAALKMLLDDGDFAGWDEVCAVLESRGYGVRRKKSGGVALYRLKRD